MFSKLLLFLVFVSCALFGAGRSIPYGLAELDEPSYYNDGVINDGETTSILEDDDQTNEDPEEPDMFSIRGILDGLKNKVNQAEKTAEEYKDKAKGKIKEAKDKGWPSNVMKKLPGGLGKRILDDLENVKENIVELLERSDHANVDLQEDQTNEDPQEFMLTARGILDGIKNKVNQAEKTAEKYKDKATGKIKEAKDKAEALPGTVLKKLPGGLGKRTSNDNDADTVNSEEFVENDDQDYRELDNLKLFEDEEQDDLFDEVEQQNDESLGDEFVGQTELRFDDQY
ncbi:hypothetical protein ACROYT_G003808 [Oculina patagonica]